jgi:hypothetical protein
MRFVPDHFTRTLQVVAVLTCLTTIAVSAEAPHWIRAITSTGSGNGCDQNQCDDVAYAVKVGADNEVYVTGRFSGTIQFAGTTLVSTGGLDFFLAKYSRSGKLLWIVQAGGTYDDYGLDLALDGAGNIYAVGGFTGTVTFGSTDAEPKSVTGNGSTIFLAKYSPSGALVWVQTGMQSVGGVNNAFAVAVNPASGTVYLTSVSQGDITFSSADGASNTVFGVWTWHMVLAKYDTTGNFHWGQTNSADPNSIPYGVAVDTKDNAYVVGWLENITTFSSQDGNSITVYGFSPGQSTFDYPDDAFLVKYDSQGNAKWANHIGGYKCVASGLAVSPRGEVSIVGFVGNINSGPSSEAVTIATSQPPGAEISLGGGDITDPFNKDVFVATYNDDGVLLRALRKGTSRDEVATSAAYDRKGHLYVTGVFQGNTAPQNVFVMKFAGRKLLWTKVATNAGVWVGNNTVISPAISVGKKGRIFVTGAYQGTASFGRITLHGTGAADIFLAELAPD